MSRGTTRMRRSRPKVDPIEKKIRESARDEECTLQFAFTCNGNPKTTVYCHSNLLKDEKGMGLKAKRGCYGCSACHDVLDWRAKRIGMTYEEMIEIFDRACEITEHRLRAKGLK